MAFNIFKKEKPREKPIEEIRVRPMEPEPYPKKTIEELESVKENKKIIGAIKKVRDPEIDIDIWTLGLIYDINLKGKNAEIVLTFTSPLCPLGDQILREIETELKKAGFEPRLELVFDPLWEPTDELRDMFGV